MDKARNGRTTIFAFTAAVSVNFMAFSAGSSYSWTSPVLPKLSLNTTDNPLPHPITTLEESWLTSLLSLGASIGPIASGIFSDRLGRKKTLLIFALPMLIAQLIITFSNNIYLYLLARFILGLGCGCGFSVIPNYVSEISENFNRGSLGCCLHILLGIGTLYSYIVGPYVDLLVFNLTMLVPLGLFYIVFGFFMPESPYYLISVQNKQGALDVLRKLRRKSLGGIEEEVAIITKNVEETKANQAGVKDLFKSRGLIKGLVVSCGLMVYQQFSGITAVQSNMQTIFDATDSGVPPEQSVIIIGSTHILMTLVTAQLVDRLGRRLLLLISTMGCFVSLIALGTYFYLKDQNYNLDQVSWFPIATLLVYILTYNAGLGPLPWVVMGELFPAHVKSLASSIATFVCLIMAFVVTMFFPHLAVLAGMAGTFWVFGVLCFTGFVFVLVLFPETKGKSVGDIQKLLEVW